MTRFSARDPILIELLNHSRLRAVRMPPCLPIPAADRARCFMTEGQRRQTPGTPRRG